MPSLTAMVQAPQPSPETPQFPPEFPTIPSDVIDRFPAMQDWQDQMNSWWDKFVYGMSDWCGTNSTVTNTVYIGNQNLIAQSNGLQAQITTLNTTVINNNAATASQIITLSALASSGSHISAQTTPPVGPTVNDLWIDTTNINAPITKYWTGAVWALQTTPIIATAISTEASARATADGFLSGKYTLTVAAGNVVTGMNITSQSGGGTNVSNVIFQAGSFQIYNGATGAAVFVASGGNVLLAGTVNVSGSNSSMYIGTGTYGNSNTQFYVDSTGKLSMGNKLTWDGTTLTITGSLTATTGTIGGWTIGATTITGGSVTLDSAGNVRAGQTAYNTGTGFWLGVNAGTPEFSIGNPAGPYLTWDGTNLTFSGTLTVGAGANAVLINSSQFSIGGGGILITGSTIDLIQTSNSDALWYLRVIAIGNSFRGRMVCATYNVTTLVQSLTIDGAQINIFDAVSTNTGSISYDGAKILISTNVSVTGTVSVAGGTNPILTTTSAITSGAGAQAGILANSPVAGNPTKWAPVNDNGVTRYCPLW